LTLEEAIRTTQTDMFALGRLVLELLTTEVPFSNLPFTSAIIIRVGGGDFPNRPTDLDVVRRGLDDHMWEFMTKCWDMDPRKRPTAAEAVNFFQALLRS